VGLPLVLLKAVSSVRRVLYSTFDDGVTGVFELLKLRKNLSAALELQNTAIT